MKKFIIKSNEWFDNLPDIIRMIFFLGAIFLVLIAQILSGMNFLWIWVAFITLTVFWRVSYTLVNWKK